MAVHKPQFNGVIFRPDSRILEGLMRKAEPVTSTPFASISGINIYTRQYIPEEYAALVQDGKVVGIIKETNDG